MTPHLPTPSPARVREVLDLALERPVRERSAFIAGICGEDDRLRAEVASLLGALDAGGDLLEPPAVATPPEAVPLTGLSFGNYRVGERVGAGGMGVVYRAEDTRLGRTVAVKALPPTLARDSHRRARFEHEARVLASLNHPNIAAIHGVEETARGPVLVLEFVPGETLARKLDQGRIPSDEAVAIAVQIARGLEAAHAAGVVHRDLKPSNIQLTPEGAVKILDFGVAKQVQPRESSDPGHTLSGQLIGTAAYMSPEQARGRPVDRRTDLWAFGCVLFAMLTGKQVFEGDTSSDTLAAVLRAEPAWSALPAQTPSHVVRLLHRCLEKDPDLRQRDAGDARLDLEGCAEAATPGTQRRSRLVSLCLIAVVAGAVGTAAGLWMRGRSPAPASIPVRFEVHTDAAAPVYLTAGAPIAISPDGQTLVYSGGSIERSRLYARRLDSHETVELAGTDGAATPCFSPDGRWIAFVAEYRLRRIPATGGGAEELVPRDVMHTGIAWDEHGVLYLSGSPHRLNRWATAGRADPIVEFGPFQQALHPAPMPGGREILVTVVENYEKIWIEAVSSGSGQRRVVIADASGATYLTPDRLMFWQAGALVCAPFDPALLRLTDVPSPVVRPITGGERCPSSRFAVAQARGVLATLPGNVRNDLTRLAWYEPDGSWTEVTQGPAFDCPRVSPDGSRIAMLMGRSAGDVWVHDVRRGSKQLLTSGDHFHHPVWTPDGQRLIFANSFQGKPSRLESVPADGSAPPTVVWEVPDGAWAYPTDHTRDGHILLTMDNRRNIDLYLLDAQGREPPRPLFPPGHRYGARLSPDGSMIAYTSEETGKMEVYLHRFPSLEPKLLVSTAGGYRPTWSGDGKKLFFRYVDRVMVVDVDQSGSELTLSSVRIVAEHLPDARYDVDREGKRLLMGRPEGDLGPQTKINVVVGWDPARP